MSSEASDPVPAPGTFVTRIAEPSTGLTSTAVRFPRKHYTSPPYIAAGLRSLDLVVQDAPAIRANVIGSDITKDGMNFGVETWDNGLLREATAVWVEHKQGAKGVGFGLVELVGGKEKERGHVKGSEASQREERPTQRLVRFHSGIGSSVESLNQQQSSKQEQDFVEMPVPLTEKATATASTNHDHITTITFPAPFHQPPTVLLWLNRLDLPTDSGQNFRVGASILDVTSSQARCRLGAWGDSQLDGAAFAWIALPEGKRGVESGIVSVGKNSDDGDSGKETEELDNDEAPSQNTGTVRFKEGSFSRVPTVQIALNMLDMAGDHDLRVEVEAFDITKEGFSWKLDTWVSLQHPHQLRY
jgi:hypothetical protein